MVKIVPSSDLRNSYPKISKLCHESSEPIYLTKNSRDDTVIMSVEAYEEMAKYAPFYKLEEGIRQAEDGEYLENDEAIKGIRKSLGL